MQRFSPISPVHSAGYWYPTLCNPEESEHVEEEERHPSSVTPLPAQVESLDHLISHRIKIKFDLRSCYKDSGQ